MAKSKTTSDFDLISSAEEDLQTGTVPLGRPTNDKSENNLVQKGELSRITLAVPADFAIFLKCESLRQGVTLSQLILPVLEKNFAQK